jgi:hypothetical protein
MYAWSEKFFSGMRDLQRIGGGVPYRGLGSSAFHWQKLFSTAVWAVATIRTVVYRGVGTIENLDFEPGGGNRLMVE